MQKGVEKWQKFYADMRDIEAKGVKGRDFKESDWFSKRDKRKQEALDDEVTHEKMAYQEFNLLQNEWKEKKAEDINLYEMEEFW